MASQAAQEGQKRAILEALRRGNTRRCAAAVAGVGHDTFYRWLRDDKTFSDNVEEAEGAAEDFYLSAINKAAATSWQAAAWWAERRKPKDYGRSDRMLILQSMQKDVEKMTDEQLYAIAAGTGAEDTPAPGED